MTQGLAGEFLRQNNWANLALIDFLSTLPPETLDAEKSGGYGTIRQTLTHMVRSLSRYHLALTGFEPAPHIEVSPELPWPGFATLREAAEGWGRGLEEVAGRSTEDWPIEKQYQEYDRLMASVVLVQAVNHCTDHRSQIATMLTQMEIEPPELDGWVWGIATGMALRGQ